MPLNCVTQKIRSKKGSSIYKTIIATTLYLKKQREKKDEMKQEKNDHRGVGLREGKKSEMLEMLHKGVE